MDAKEICLRLADAAGVSGDERAACECACQILGQSADVHIDRMNNVIGRIEGRGKRFLLDAHIDRIGLIVRGVNEKGFVLFDKCGGVDPRTLIGSEVEIFGKEKLFGVICSVPPHLAGDDDKLPEITKMAIDIGFGKEEAEKLVFPGDRIIIRNKQNQLLGKRISSAALDDRAGVAVLIKAVEILKKEGFTADLTLMFSSQEEVGGRGAKTGSFANQADEAIVVDVTFATQPDVGKEEGGELGKGPLIGFSPVLDREMSLALVDTAKEHGIPYDCEVMGRSTGTNADEISVSAGGIKTATVSVPLRNMHTAAEVIDTDDIENSAKLIACYILENGGKENA
ncbi:MAG: M20/M25/M40 family metallo-hydrolase [Acutalibacteraceae bacterium]